LSLSTWTRGHGGDESLAELVREHGELPATVEALTGGGGRHLFSRTGGTIRNRSNMRPGIDVRGDGGYIVVAPSNHASEGNTAGVKDTARTKRRRRKCPRGCSRW
jgi:hypothetical protein